MFLEASPLLVCLIASALGVVSHLSYFIYGEHHLHSLRLFSILFLGPLLFFIGILKLSDNSSCSVAARLTAAATACFLISLTISILTYRVFLHPLRKFPGPFSAKLTKLSHAFRIAKRSNNYLQAAQLHEKYGDIVRVGPNELTLTIPEAIPALLGPGSKCIKSPWYDIVGLPHLSLHSTRDRVTHEKRRKVWDRGFSTKSLRDYSSRVLRYSDELIAQLHAFSGKPVSASLWFNFYSFDVMGDLAFGRSFGMLQSGEKHFALELLGKGMAPLGILTPIPWIFPILQGIPGAGAGFQSFVNWCNEQALARKKNPPEGTDVMSWLIDAEKAGNDPMLKDHRWLSGDARLIIVAGSDTVASSLTFLFYHLAREPYVVDRLREELKHIYRLGSKTEIRDLQDAKYLNGIINEALRLHPPVPSGVLRTTPPEGLTIGSIFIPGNVTVSAPTWATGRLESCFKHAQEFLPERWNDRPELVLNKEVFVPFSSGPFSCIGKQLALIELRTVVARIVTLFDIKFADSEDGSSLLEKTKDNFTLDLAPLMLVFTKRL